MNLNVRYKADGEAEFRIERTMDLTLLHCTAV